MILQSLIAATLGCAPMSDARTAHDTARTSVLQRRGVSPEDLLSVVDVAGLSASPDGGAIVYQLVRADADADRVDTAWLLQENDGCFPLLTMSPFYPRIRGRPGGVIVTLEPRWSPDGARVAILDAAEGLVQVCVRATRACMPLTAPDGAIADMAWRDGGSLVVATQRPAPPQTPPREGRLVDDSFELLTGLRIDREGTPGALSVALLREGAEPAWRTADADDRLAFDAHRPDHPDILLGAAGPQTNARAAPRQTTGTSLAPSSARLRARWGAHAAAWAEPIDARLAGMRPPLMLFASADRDGVRRCTAPACSGYIMELAGQGSDVVFVRREGPALSQTAVWLWNLATGDVTRLFGGDDLVAGCRFAGARILCLRAGAVAPTQIIALDRAGGEPEILVDPNASLRPRLAPAEKQLWRTDAGQEVFGWLVRAHRPDGPALSLPGPLVIAQYRARGFLRGGVGDELPVQALAASGLSVLVVERPDNLEADATARDNAELEAAEWRGLAERRRTLSAVERGADLMVARGVADPDRIGLHGMSDGAETAMFALIHAPRFAAIATAGGAHEPGVYDLLRTSARPVYRATGRAPLLSGDDSAWADLSVALNVANVRAPLLIQSADSELLYVASTRRALEEARKPFELWSFDNEGHVKRSPAHRRAVYWRNLDWFSFWIGSGVLAGPDRVDAARRWQELRRSTAVAK